jgi:LCP family protein required for cell wall assembly
LALLALVVALTSVVILRARAGEAASATPSPSPSATLSEAARLPPLTLGAAHPGVSYVSALQGERPLFILALGSDARPGQPIEQQRSDSIHIIGVNLVTHHASILGFPRDSWVDIPGHGFGKINSAMVMGGPKLMIQTLEALTGIKLDFWLLTSFPGFKAMVDGIGGVTVDVPYPMHDDYSHADFEPGVHELNGSQALAFSRDRHDVPGGDLGRSFDQGIMFMSVLSRLHDTFGNDPGIVFKWISIGWHNVSTELSVPTLLELGLTASQVASGDVTNTVVPGIGGFEGSAAVVFLSPEAPKLYADLKADGVIGKNG